MDTPLFDGELVHARRMIYTTSAFAKSNLVHLQEVGQLLSPRQPSKDGFWAAARWNMRARPAC